VLLRDRLVATFLYVRVTERVIEKCETLLLMRQREIRLLGQPAVLIEGSLTAPPRGSKVWGLLAYLASTSGGHPRSQLAELLFGGAEDPLGALRWNLAQLRRLLDMPDALKGANISLDLPANVAIDTQILEAGDAVALEVPGLGQELLAGLSFPDSPAFDLWLLTERRRLARRTASLLGEETLTRLSRSEYEAAIGYATQLVSIDPLDEGYHALLIRAHALAGDHSAARRQYDHCREILNREVGSEPGAAVIAAMSAVSPRSIEFRADQPENVDARVDVAWRTFHGGAVDHGIDLGRSAVAMADSGRDQSAQLWTRLFLGAMLGMAVRGWDECAAVLNEALNMAGGLGWPVEAATALGILAGNDMMRADYESATRHAHAGLARSDDPGARSANLMFLAAVGADTASFDEAIEHARAAFAAAEASTDPIRIVYAASHAGRVFLMHGDMPGAREFAEEAVAVASGTLLTLLPWPLTILAEIEIASRELDVATRRARQAAALAATTHIAYQRALACRAMGLAEAARGNTGSAVDYLTQALAYGQQTTGEGYTFHWPVAFVLDSLSTVTAESDPETSQRWAAALQDHVTSLGMHTFTTSAQRKPVPASLGRLYAKIGSH